MLSAASTSGGLSPPHLGPILAQRRIPPVRQAILNAPVAANQAEQSCGAGLSGGQAGDAVDDGLAHCPRPTLHDAPFRLEDLLGIRSVQVRLQGATHGDRAAFQAPMPFGRSVVVRKSSWEAGLKPFTPGSGANRVAMSCSSSA